ncbi:hypothetical protein KSS87_012898 [Heliosperma pusillum]|nr:hypothetical protein KSS87_008576 [Heliosperma pusillum]KAH9612833.1 hypothetical protein KSS87_008362 [Heliosperma pusillum]KAH9619778.1 hypothetical protein KSS87_012898 [Heliosperma pusillum]
MAGRLGKRVVNFANLPIKLLMPSTFSNISEIALKTIPSATKIEIKRVLESLYGFEVEKVQTLNMDGKKKKRGGILLAKPDYKKAYVTLKYPLSISPDLFPIKVIKEDKEELDRQRKTSIVEAEGQKKSHWLEEKRSRAEKTPPHSRPFRPSRPPRRGGREETAKFPWTSMRNAGSAAR